MLPSTILVAAATLFSAASASPARNVVVRRDTSHIIIPKLDTRTDPPTNSSGAAPAGSQTVVVASGDTLSKLAEQFGVGICDIAKASNLADPNVINPGQTLTIPPPTATPDNASCLPPPPPPASAACSVGGPDRLVIPDDGLSAELAAKFLNITLDSFAAANAQAFATVANSSTEALAATNLTGKSVMSVPVCPGSSCTISQGTIKQGDVFDAVAAAAGSTTGQILALNPGIDRLNLQIGQTFTLPSNCKNGTADAAAAAGEAAAPAPATPAAEPTKAADPPKMVVAPPEAPAAAQA